MSFQKQENGAGRVSGELHISEVDELRAALLAWLDDPLATALQLDGVRQCDTASLQLLCSLKESIRTTQKQCRISPLPPAILEISGILGFSISNQSAVPHELAE